MIELRKLLFCSAVIFAKSSVFATAEANHLAPPTETSAYEAKHRLGLAEKQRALVEKISESACMVAHGANVERFAGEITKSVDMFERVLAGLRSGDAELDLVGEEHYSRVLKALDASDARWADFRAAADAVVAEGAVTDANADMLFEKDDLLLDELQGLVTAVETAYANPADMMLANAMMIDLAGRQEMLTQAIGKDVCLIHLGWLADKHRESLKGKVDVFLTTHNALADGMPALGLKPAPTPEIKDALDAFFAKWSALRPVIDKSLAGDAVALDELEAFEEENFSLLKDLDVILGMYEKL